MIPASVRVTEKGDLDLGRPPTTVAAFLDALEEVRFRLRGESGEELHAFISLVQAMPRFELQALIDSRPPTVQWIERTLVAVRRRVSPKIHDAEINRALALATAVLRGEKWLAS